MNLKDDSENEQLSFKEDFKSRFIFEFTKQLIKNSAPIEVLKFQQKMIESIVEPKKIVHEEIREIVHETLQPIIKKKFSKDTFSEKTFYPKNLKGARLFIPKINLPERFNYLKPTATNKNLDLGKLNPLLNDPLIKTIECQGEGTNILVRGSIGNKRTAIVLTEDEIKSIINKFSYESKIPVQEGFFKVVVGKYIIIAVYSEIVGSKFMIQKISSFQKY
jgi:hypothetical protein